MQYGTINDITNLKFYTDNGQEIPMQKVYSMTWHFIPGTLAKQYMQDELHGYFIGDVDLSDTEDIKIIKNSIIAGVIGKGNIQVRFASSFGKDKNGMRVLKYGSTIRPYEYYSYMKTILMDAENQLVISINVNNNNYTTQCKFTDIFTMDGTPDRADSSTSGIKVPYSEYYSINTIYTGNNIADDHEYYQVIQVEYLDFVMQQDESELIPKPYIQKIFETAVPNIGVYFPFVTYQGSFHQEMISEGFIAADTLMVLEENFDENGFSVYRKPYIDVDSEYYILFKPTDVNGELKMIKKDLTYEIEYTDEISFDLAEPEIETTVSNPLYFSVAFQSSTEGAYQNYLGMYMRSKNNPDISFYMGIISVKTIVEGEDERFRTLLTNFGVPDPAYYSNIFAEQEYDEQGKDYDLINRKSKQLMLTYDQIFSYVGTYKALMNAVKFLGYYDIIFKEWYTLKTTNDTNVDVAVQVFDTSNGVYLKQKLADYGISIEDFANYNKINKLSMIYHINEESDRIEEVKQQYVHFDASLNRIVIDASGATFTTPTGVPLTKPVYIYRNDEILTKLISVKKWLETHIIGVGAYIADITGEGVYFGWQKTQGYQTQHHLTDFSQNQYYTANVKKCGTFKNSSTDIVCTLNELNNSVTFDDYENYTFGDFIKYERDIELETVSGVYADLFTLIVSNTIEAPVLGDEYEFDLNLKTGTGTLCEWMKDASSQILFDEGEIKLLYEQQFKADINVNKRPYIVLENANIHDMYGSWSGNIKWMIREVIDAKTGNTVYKMKNYKTALRDGYAAYNKTYFILERDPHISDAYLRYTEETKWGVPMFMIHGFKCMNLNVPAIQKDNFNISEGHYIIEILKGDILFGKSGNHGAKVMFDNDYLMNANIDTGLYDKKQRISLEYTYQSVRKPFVKFDENQIIEDSSNPFDFTDQIKGNINNCKSDILRQYTEMLDRILERNGKTAEESCAYQEALNFINNTVAQDIDNYFVDVSTQAEKRMLYDEYVKSCIRNYVCNQDISVNVNRLGTYDVIAKAYDRYNNVFVSKYGKNVKVETNAIPIDTYTYNASSNNSPDFHNRNINGIEMTADELQNIASKCDKFPSFPANYKIASFDNDPKKFKINFENMSYCIDTPKNGDYVIFENCTERCSFANDGTASNRLKIWMIDENPNKIHLYSQNTTRVNLVIYNKSIMDDVSVIAGIVTDRFYQDPQTDTDFNSNSYLDIQFDNYDIQQIRQMVNDKSYISYILNTTEYDLKNFNYIIDYDKNQTFLIDSANGINHNYPLFNIEDVIKMRYSRIYQVPENASVSTKSQTISETAYRITVIYIHTSDGKRIDMKYVDFDKYDKSQITNYEYVINGRLNETLIGQDCIQSIITYANEYPVHYTVPVVGDGIEYNKNMGYGNYHVLYDEFAYDYKHMSIGNYIDDTYSGRILDYDRFNLINTWDYYLPSLDKFDDINMYCYHNFPVTVNAGKMILFTHHDIDNILEPGYHVEWIDRCAVLDDTDNRLAYSNSKKKETLYRCVSNVVSVEPEILGPHDLTLICIDKYGNKVTNNGFGHVYIK